MLKLPAADAAVTLPSVPYSVLLSIWIAAVISAGVMIVVCMARGVGSSIVGSLQLSCWRAWEERMVSTQLGHPHQIEVVPASMGSPP